MEDPEKYVVRDERLPILLKRLKAQSRTSFLLTNSEYEYTNAIMSYLLNDLDEEWTSYFDYIVVDAKKPRFFAEGTILKQVDRETGQLRLGTHTGPLQRNHVYSGGSCDGFSAMIGAKGRDVLYVGDHIFGDILKSKKIRGWRTFLIIPELFQELHIWHSAHETFHQLQDLDSKLGNMYKTMDSTSVDKPDIRQVQTSIKNLVRSMDQSYGVLGSLFRQGSRQTMFASQVCRYADVYSSTCLNLLYYPFSYLFRAPPVLMPHELTTQPKDIIRGSLSGNGVHPPIGEIGHAKTVDLTAFAADLEPNDLTKTPIALRWRANTVSSDASSAGAAVVGSISGSVGSAVVGELNLEQNNLREACPEDDEVDDSDNSDSKSPTFKSIDFE